jgi:hypothetical protein
MAHKEGHMESSSSSSVMQQQGGSLFRGHRTATTQFAEGTILSCAPYLLNLFLEDCKDAQDLGKEFHYSWLLILIALFRWRENR